MDESFEAVDITGTMIHCDVCVCVWTILSVIQVRVVSLEISGNFGKFIPVFREICEIFFSLYNFSIYNHIKNIKISMFWQITLQIFLF